MGVAHPRAKSPTSVSTSRLDLTIEDFPVGGPFDMQDADQTPLGAREGVIDQDIVARHIQLEFRDDGAARRHNDGLYAAQWLAQDAAKIVDAIENLTDHVE